ncbi:MAG TPA: beta-ketoacyl-ACP synthase [Hyphomicrobium sp.]|nr:beta-ketoacyl-ACP synthase [Hyphomicrobium sp.]
MDGDRDVWITGIGLLSGAGEGNAAHAPGIDPAQPRSDIANLSSYPIHPLCAVDFGKQIPKASEQRQMGLWQRTGVYAAGLALADAGLADRPDVLDRTHVLVAAGNGERDCGFDSKVLDNGICEGASPDRLNEALLTGLRPTLYLGELSNLLAGNISIVHHATGSSRTFKGEEIAGVSAVENAYRRIAAGQGDVFLVGGALNAQREDLLLGYELGSYLWPHPYQPVWSRKELGGGFTPGSAGAFLVVEARGHAQARGREPYARIRNVVSDRCGRESGEISGALHTLFGKLNVPQGPLPVVSGASGVEPVTSGELAFFQDLERRGYQPAVRAHGTRLGHSVEAHFPAGVCLAALALAAGRFYQPFEEGGTEKPFEGELSRVLVTGLGHWRGEGLALLEFVE